VTGGLSTGEWPLHHGLQEWFDLNHQSGEFPLSRIDQAMVQDQF
jgi:hypothetical protein